MKPRNKMFTLFTQQNASGVWNLRPDAWKSWSCTQSWNEKHQIFHGTISKLEKVLFPCNSFASAPHDKYILSTSNKKGYPHHAVFLIFAAFQHLYNSEPEKNIPHFAGWCSTLTLLLIRLSFSRDNGHPLLIWSLKTTQTLPLKHALKWNQRGVMWPSIFPRFRVVPSTFPQRNSADSTQWSEIMDLWSRRSPEITGRFKKALRLWTCDDECPLKKQKTRLIRMFDDKNIFL